MFMPIILFFHLLFSIKLLFRVILCVFNTQCVYLSIYTFDNNVTGIIAIAIPIPHLMNIPRTNSIR